MITKAEQMALSIVTTDFKEKADKAALIGNTAEQMYFTSLYEWLEELAKLREEEEEYARNIGC